MTLEPRVRVTLRISITWDGGGVGHEGLDGPSVRVWVGLGLSVVTGPSALPSLSSLLCTALCIFYWCVIVIHNSGVDEAPFVPRHNTFDQSHSPAPSVSLPSSFS